MSELWSAPSPSSGFLKEASLGILPQRSCILSFTFEGASGDPETCELRFREVVAFKCTYLPALTVEMIRSAYDKLVDVENSPWLAEARSVRTMEGDASLRHLRICFDDGPCYEFLCKGFESVRRPASALDQGARFIAG